MFLAEQSGTQHLEPMPHQSRRTLNLLTGTGAVPNDRRWSLPHSSSKQQDVSSAPRTV